MHNAGTLRSIGPKGIRIGAPGRSDPALCTREERKPMTEAPLREVRRVVYRPLREGNALEDTVARLVQTIRLGVVAPGESLPPERELAARYGVSRDTVREAIRELADTGFLVRRRGRYGGTFVADPLPQPPHPGVVPLEELDDVLGLRRVIEAGRLAHRSRAHADPRGAHRPVGAARSGLDSGRRGLPSSGHPAAPHDRRADGHPLARRDRGREQGPRERMARHVPAAAAQHRALQRPARAHRLGDPRGAGGCRRSGDSRAPRRLGGAAARLPRADGPGTRVR